MKRLVFAIVAIAASINLHAQKELDLTDVMLYKSEGSFLTDNLNWNSEDIQLLDIYKKTEKRIAGKDWDRHTFDFSYWTWKNESFSSGISFFKDANNGMSVTASYNGIGLTLVIINNSSTNYLLVKMDTQDINYCTNENEGVTFEMLPSVGNSLRNTKYQQYDYALIPPMKKGTFSFRSIMGIDVLPASLPSRANVQWCMYGAFSNSDNWDDISRKTVNKPLIKDEVKYFSLSSSSFADLVNNYFSPFVGFESRYHLIVK